MRVLLLLSLAACVSDAVVQPDSSTDPDGGAGAPDGATDQSSSAMLMGKVMNELGEAVMGADVHIASMVVKTAPDGSFSAPAPATYDATVVIKGGPDRWTHFTALTTRAPVLQANANAVSGAMTGAGVVVDASSHPWPPQSPHRVVATYSTEKGAAVTRNATFNAKNIVVPSLPYGRSATMVTGTAYVLRFTASPTSFVGLPEKSTSTATGMLLVGSGTYMAMNGGSATPTVQLYAANAGMNPFAHRPISVSYTLPMGMNAKDAHALIDVPPDEGRIVISGTAQNPSSSFEFDTPTTFGAAKAESGAAVCASTLDRRDSCAWEIGKTSPGALTLSVPPPLPLLKPADKAIAPPNADLSWDGAGRTGAFYVASVQCPTVKLDIVTTATSTKLPQPGGQKLSGACTWTVKAVTPIASADDLAKNGWMRHVSFATAPTNGSSAESFAWSLTIQ